MKPETIKEGKASDSIDSGVDLQRLVLCSTSLCGAAAKWVCHNPHIYSGYERKCETCYYRNQHNHNPRMRPINSPQNTQEQGAKLP